MELGREYWNQRWLEQQTGWDIGSASAPLTDFALHLNNRSLRILIPGAGNAWEAEFLFRHGFTHVHVLDIAPQAIAAFQTRVPDFPAAQLINGDFFAHTGHYDLILEQTFFCALHPSLRKAYVQKMHSLLAPGGTLAGVLFDAGFEGGPPFGGSAAEYRSLFEPYFELHTLETARNSIQPRAGREVFIRFTPRANVSPVN
ncbi:MAG: TPMT family class I SAM-dependent methyltransferase [Bacteroidia bacterium]|jgi:thiopurine S-methyltransferase|nr:TPMT family class I SAM-dependent methyltransferase [Bacteroidia bacterium]